MKSTNDPSIEFEPQYQTIPSRPKAKPRKDQPPAKNYDPPLGMNPVAESLSTLSDDDVEYSVWDEPCLPAAQKQYLSDDALTYANWFSERKADFGAASSWAVTLVIACLSGPWGLMTLLFYGYGSGWGWGQFTVTVLLAPLLQELGKIMVLLWVVEKRPYWFTSWFQIFICSIMSATCFVVVFNSIGWLTGNAPMGQFFQWSAFFLMHLMASSLSAIGLKKIWQETNDRLVRPKMDLGYPWFRAAFLINAGFGLAVIVAGWCFNLLEQTGG
jgi:hypothetical protein